MDGLIAKIAAIPVNTGVGIWNKSAKNNAKMMAIPVLIFEHQASSYCNFLSCAY